MPFDASATAPSVTGPDAPVAPTTRRQRIDAERREARSGGRRSARVRSASRPAASAPHTEAADGPAVTPAHRPLVVPPVRGAGVPLAAATSARVRGSRTGSVPVVAQRRAAVAAPRRAGRGRGAGVATDGALRRAAERVTGAVALLFVAGLVVSTSLPAQASWSPMPLPGHAAAGTTAQSLTVGDGASDAETGRDGYTVSQPAAASANTSDTFTNDPNGTIQWPFMTGVPITSGFGARNVEGCSFCSTFHEGADFAPGAGTPIRVIAAGTVTKVQADDGGYGNDVWVEHDVDGKRFVSVYGHMEDDSFEVVEGQHVAVGDELGLVGSTGNSTGPHLHLEVHVDGVAVDPIAWLRANAD
ncbi:hypothetical protein DEI92_11245 [Curtobacterium sp. MCBD17_034]|nr:hypothetical protein DEI82_11315 [Curtobacterium sp. MCBD17_019]PZF58615.1 hypothetical protein DEI92_11245 [Curtobacterium sp. MCBD17_034]PZM34605.1 hypothetical protein DEI90_07815 [Curtobacterium sp. MCBD17_031]